MNKIAQTKNSGFTLVEIMIALAISLFVLMGITATYSSINWTIQASKELENAQEVIRYSSHVFTRSLKQTIGPVNVTVAQQLTVPQPANVIPCTGGAAPVIPYIETYTFNAVTEVLSCRVDGGADIALLRGITTISYTLNAAQNVMTIIVQPLDLPQNFAGGVQGVQGVQIDIALTNLILQAAMPAA